MSVLKAFSLSPLFRRVSQPLPRAVLQPACIAVFAAMVATSLVAPGSTFGQASPAPPRTVTVKSGDTLEGIAQRYGVSVAELKRVNSLKDADLLQVGQTLRLPVPPRKGVVTVKSGDTLESIAKAQHTTAAALQKANPGIQPNNLKVGSTLRLPSSAGHSTPATKGSAPAGKAAPSAPAAKAPTPAVKTPTPTPAPEIAPATTSAAPRPPLVAETPLSPERTESPSRGRWRYYGDTVVDWGGWKRLPDGVRYTLVQAAAKDVGETRAQATAIAVDCSTLRHNWRVKETWEAWSIPAPRSVGQQIVLDLCGNAAGDERRPVPAPPSPSP
ncbi:MAG: LysM peptidoglycan-binding domain-containing protein [Cyanobacteriota bacterium]